RRRHTRSYGDWSSDVCSSDLASLPQPASSRLTPRGDRYNYDDGYLLTDTSGNYGGQTWYWGYDNSANQISGNTIMLSRSTIMGRSEERRVGKECKARGTAHPV